MNKAPILLLTHKKSNAIEAILDAINIYNPPKLYIFQNQPKNTEEITQTELVKSIIISKQHLFQQLNYKQHLTYHPVSESITKAIDFVFQHEEKLLILEDDIVPNMSFFDFCNHLLVKYDGSSEIGCINGCNLNSMDIDDKYIYSDISFPYWGWATWREKWFKFRFDNYYWDQILQDKLNLSQKKNHHFFKKIFETNANSLNVWDLQWNLTLIANSYKTIIPTVNLVKNNGFVSTALSTHNSQSPFSDMKTKSININTLKKKIWNTNRLVRKYETKIKELVKEISSGINKTQIENLKYGERSVKKF